MSRHRRVDAQAARHAGARPVPVKQHITAKKLIKQPTFQRPAPTSKLNCFVIFTISIAFYAKRKYNVRKSCLRIRPENQGGNSALVVALDARIVTLLRSPTSPFRRSPLALFYRRGF
jgi:hypothetical protein